ncbi:methylenetetrahydrofolate reductase [Arthrobacter monumenti]
MTTNVATPCPKTGSTTYPALSYELYPPRSPSAEAVLWRTIRELEATAPDYVSVTYGAGGSNHNTALDLLARIHDRTTLRPLAHLTCVGKSRAELAAVIDALIDRGVRGILALRGDEPQSGSAVRELERAVHLVELVREVERTRTAHLAAGRLSIGVAAYANRHPESPSVEHDVDVLLAKQAAGADFAVTQLFFRPGEYRDLLKRAQRAGVVIPVIPGIMPFTSIRRINRLSELAGIAPDAALMDRLTGAGDAHIRHERGLQATVELAEEVLEAGAPGLHLYTFNDHTATLEIVNRLDLARPSTNPTTPSTSQRIRTSA